VLYERRLKVREMRCFPLTDEFPCLRRSSLSPSIRSARYSMELDRVEAPWVDQDTMLQNLGIA
jgi:hypothetical protein